MAIYIILLNNLEEEYSETIFENFESENEVLKFKNENEFGGTKIASCVKAESLAVLLSEALFDFSFSYGERLPRTFWFKLLEQKKIGMELLNSQFPDELLNLDLLFEKVERLIDDMEDDLREEVHQSEMLQIEGDDSNHDAQIDAAEEEMKRWDEEDPSWRIANDLD